MAMVKITPEMAEAAVATIDWAAIDAMTDDDIARQIAENPDAAPDLTIEGIKLLWRIKSGKLKMRHKVRLVRRALHMSQAQFAKAYRLPLRTLQNWEQGTREPDEASAALIKLIAYKPDEVRKVLND